MSENDVISEHDDSPELTEQDFARAISFSDVAARDGRRHEASESGFARATVAFALDADLVGRIRESGPNYDARVEAILNEALADGRI